MLFDRADLIVLWSGGMDSTVLLHHLLNNDDKYGNNNIGAVALTPNFIPQDKAMNENAVRERYMKDFIDNREVGNFTYANINTFDHPLMGTSQSTGGNQLCYWITTVYPYVGKDASILISVLKGDDQIKFIDESIKLVESMNKFYGKNVKLCFPLMNLVKEDMFVFAAKYKILDYTWSCEEGGYFKGEEDIKTKQCKKCRSCYEHISGLVTVTSHPNIDPSLHDYALHHFGLYTLNTIEGMIEYPSYRFRECIGFIDLCFSDSGVKTKPKLQISLEEPVDIKVTDLTPLTID